MPEKTSGLNVAGYSLNVAGYSLNVAGDKTQHDVMQFEVGDMQMLSDERQAALQFKPDNWKAYMEFTINHAMPVVAGPTMKGNYLAYHPAVIARSCQSLLHQQLNLEHKIKAYNPDKIARDRILGAIVAVSFPTMPFDQWKIGDDKAAAPAIRAVAAIFKQAEGVNRILGNHQASRQTWNNSIEVIYPVDEMGVYIPSSREVLSVDALPAAMKGVIERDRTGHLIIGKFKGEQLAFAPGCVDGTIEYQGVGMTRNPAEKEAEIDQILASARMEGEMMAVAASAHPLLMFRNGVKFLDAHGRTVRAWVKEICESGTVKVPGCPTREATEEKPILVLRTRDGLELSRSLQSVAVC